MALKTQRFGARLPNGARSSEWAVMWKTNTSDVYVATRTVGRWMKLSLHESGQCHVRGPGSELWQGLGEPPHYIDLWHIDTLSQCQLAFRIFIPSQELRACEWYPHKKKGTVWIQAEERQSVEIGLFFVRSEGDLAVPLAARGWTSTLLAAPLPDGRRLVVAIGMPALPEATVQMLEEARRGLQAKAAVLAGPADNLRAMLYSGPDEQGVRSFVEVAVDQAPSA